MLPSTYRTNAFESSTKFTGTKWDSLITLNPSNAFTTLTMRMDTETRPLVPRLLMPFMLRLFIRKAVEKDFDAVKACCERSSVS